VHSVTTTSQPLTLRRPRRWRPGGTPKWVAGRTCGSGAANVGIWRTSTALEVGEPGQALLAAKPVHPELLPKRNQVQFGATVGRAMRAGNKTRDKGVRVLLHAEQLAPQRIHHDVLVRETVAGLLRQSRRDAGGRELRRLAWRMGLAPVG
jgi:hypothetical protein